MKAPKWIAVWAIAMIGLTTPAFAQATTAPAIEYKIKETRVGPWPVPGADPEIFQDGVYFSPDGCHFAVAFTRIPGRYLLSVDGGPRQREYDLDGSPYVRFSPDGKRLAFTGLKVNQWFVVVDGKAEPCDTPFKLMFSHDSKHFAYEVEEHSGKYFMVLDSWRIPGPNKIFPCGFAAISPDGRRLAWGASTGNAPYLYYAVLDGQPSPPYDRVNGIISGGSEGLIFSPDSKRLAYAAAMAKKAFVVVDGQNGPSFDEIKTFPCFSPDSKRLAYVALNGKSVFAVVDGQPGQAYDQIDSLMFTPDSKDPVYFAKTGGKWSLIVGDHTVAEFQDIVERSLQFSPDGNQIEFIARTDAGLSVFLNGVAGRAYDWIGSLQFSPDGKRIAYGAVRRGGDGCAVIDGQESTPGGGRFHFSPDSKHLAYVAGGQTTDGPGKPERLTERVILDGQPGPVYDTIVDGGPSFQSDGVLEYLAIKAGSIYRVKYIPVP